jgi:hypothetical protein
MTANKIASHKIAPRFYEKGKHSLVKGCIFAAGKTSSIQDPGSSIQDPGSRTQTNDRLLLRIADGGDVLL